MSAGWSDPQSRMDAKHHAEAYDEGAAHDDGPLLIRGIVFALLIEAGVLIGVAGITFLVFVIATGRL